MTAYTIKLSAAVVRVFSWITLCGIALLALGWGVLHWVIVPRIDEYRPRLEAMATRTLGTPVRIAVLSAHSNGLVPSITLEGVEVLDASGRSGLRIRRVLAAFSVSSLVRLGFEQLALEEPELEIRRNAGGRVFVGGLDLSGDASADTGVADWFFAQSEFVVRRGSVRWVDERRQAAPVRLTDVNFVARNGVRSHQLRLDATPQPEWGERFTLIGRFRQPLFARHAGYWRDWTGQLYASFPRVDVSQLRVHANLREDFGADVREGHGALRIWADVRQGAWTQSTADLALGGVAVALGRDLKPLELQSLTGRLAWQRTPGGFTLQTQRLQFRDRDQLAWQGGNLSFSYRDGSEGTHAGGALNADRLDLAVLTKIALRLPLPASVHEQLRAQTLAGLIESIDARWSGPLDAPADWRARGQASGLVIGARAAPGATPQRPQPGVPGLEGGQLTFEAQPGGGHATLHIDRGALHFPGVFEEPRLPLDRLRLDARWRVQGERIDLTVDELTLANADLSGTARGSWHTADPATARNRSRFPGVLDLQAQFPRANGARIQRYLPLAVAAEARQYVKAAILQGEASDVAVRVRGDLLDAPAHTPAEGEFRFAGQVRGVQMAYVPRHLQPAGQPAWPALTELGGQLVIDRNTLQVRDAHARVQDHPGWQFDRIQARIDDLNHTRVVVDAQGSGPLAAALGIVKASPAAGFTRHALDQAQTSGAATLRLGLDLPIASLQDARVKGIVTLPGNDLRLTPDAPLLAGSRGTITFNETGFSVPEVQTELLGGTARVSGGSQPGGAVRLRASGSASVEALRRMDAWGPVPALAQQASGDAAYEAELGWRGGHSELTIASDLRGVRIDLPQPLGKPADGALPLRVETREEPDPRGGGRALERIRVRLADVLATEHEHERSPGSAARLRRGVLSVGALAREPLALPDAGVLARVSLPRLDVDEWNQTLNRLAAAAPSAAAASAVAAAAAAAAPALSNDYLPTVLDVRAAELLADRRTLHDVVMTGTREGGHWRLAVQARELAGQLAYQEGGQKAGTVYARLTRLTVPPTQEEARTLLVEPASSIPALDIVVDELELGGLKLGRLEVKALNRERTDASGRDAPSDWSLEAFNLVTPEAVFMAKGLWSTAPRERPLALGARAPRAEDERRRTRLDFSLDIRDSGQLLTRLGMPGVVRGGRGQMRGELGWAGLPMAPHYPTLDGQLHLDVGAGQFLKAEPGIAKLLGVLSLQSLPRRLTLDFRDVFSAGFAFDFVRGDVQVRAGQARTNNLQMKGANAAVAMEGKADLVAETQDLRVVVVPEIDAGNAALVATAIHPAVGLGTFLAQLILRRPLAQATTREFHIGGRWDNPVVERVTRAPAGAATAPAAAPAPAQPASSSASDRAVDPPPATAPAPALTASEPPCTSPPCK